MNANLNPHLTEAQLYDLLDANADRATELHMAECANCSQEFAQLSEALANFRLAANGIALTHEPIRKPLATPQRMHFRPAAWATGLATAALVVAGSLTALHRHTAIEPAPIAVTAPTHDSISDEALLQDIDSDLSASVPAQLKPLDVTATSGRN
jgi:hypothetical protein